MKLSRNMGEFTIKTDRLVLRPFKLSDADSYFAMTRDRAIREYVPYACADSIEETREDISKYYSKGDLKHDYYLVIESKETHQMIGALIITQNANQEFEFCMMIAKERRRQGYITEATKAFIKILPAKSVLIWKIREDNIASLQAISKLQDIYGIEVTVSMEQDGTCSRVLKCTV